MIVFNYSYSLSEVTHDSHFSASSLAPSTDSVSAMESSPGATEPRPFSSREDGRPPIPLLNLFFRLLISLFMLSLDST